MPAVAHLGSALRDLALYALAIIVFFTPIEGFLRYRLRRVSRRGARHAYVALADPWVPLVVAASGAGVVALLVVLG
jgi:hypothetical protein